MALIFPIILCFIPLIFMFFVLFFGCKIKAVHLLWTMAISLVCVLPVSVIQFFMGMIPFFMNQSLVFILLKSIILYGLIEEVCKTCFVMVLPKKNYSGFHFLMISFFFGLSLGCFESVIYFLDHFQKAAGIGADLLYRPIFIRMITSDLLHTFCSGILGICIYEKRRGDFHLSLIFLAVLLHGVYDFFAGFANGFKFFSIAVILFSLIECRVKYTIYINSEK